MPLLHGEEIAVYEDHWHSAWKRGIAPNKAWDQNGPAALLAEFLKSTNIKLDGCVAFVPGCGRGWDAIELARHGCSVTGLDLVPEAVEEAQRTTSSVSQGGLKGGVEFHAGDFFKYRLDDSWVDVGYDCTFLCALQPHQFKDWAAAWAKAIKPGGHLITLQFPLDTCEDGTKCPPWPMSKQLYADLLTPHGFKNVHQTDTRKGCFTDRPGIAKKGHGGLEALACWQKS
ncbi:hypothetical protein WJX73_001774 [Symbiochloris irregularis]|uniref:Thiol methyltransferase 1 n=1 Tax=Symbiochloris irregularis TaxID=706552 RepID=A0AAW1PV13_9CHLO